MKRIQRCLLMCAVLVLVGQVRLLAEDWPGWRGPRRDGTSLESNLPTKWSGTENVVWKTPIPGAGHSSPIIWGDRIFLTTADVATKDRILLSLDRKSGKILWQKTVVNAPLEAKQGENSYASSTPVTDGEKVYVAFLAGDSVVMAAYDFAGEQKWSCTIGRFNSTWGFCQCPVLLGDKLLIGCCGKSMGFVTAVSRVDGKTLWSVEPKNNIQSFSSPCVGEMAGRLQMIVQGNGGITSYDPNDGKELWNIDGPSKEFVLTPVYHAKAGLLLGGSSWPSRIIVAIKPDGHGNVTAEKIVWKTKDGSPYVPSPIAVGDYFLTASFDVKRCWYCYEAATGNLMWKQEDVGLHHASPVAANGLVYFLNDDGVMNIVKAGPKFELVATNALGEKTYGSPAISQGQIFLRGFNNLYCIGAAK